MAEYPGLREIPIRDEQVFHGVLIDVTHMQVTLPNGGTSLREIVRHPGGAAVVPLDGEGNVTLVRQHRVALDLMTLEIPAGKLNGSQEDPLLAAARELEEETGLRAGRMEWLTTMLPTPGYCTEKLHLYLATGLTPCRPHLDADEFLDVVKIPFAQALEMVDRGELADGKTALALLLAQRRMGKAPLEGTGPSEM
ncbi:MAG: NUDIX hydrolase [Candidatus Limiplasma sp.]|nr:NUDIX hydrolase [Candidatus Limiplasma sp.]